MTRREAHTPFVLQVPTPLCDDLMDFLIATGLKMKVLCAPREEDKVPGELLLLGCPEPGAVQRTESAGPRRTMQDAATVTSLDQSAQR